MGQMLIRCARGLPGLEVVAAVEQSGHAALGQDAGLLAGAGKLGVPLVATWPTQAGVIVDFTFHTAVPGNVAQALAAKQGLVLGTTGLSEPERQVVLDAARVIPVVWTPNFSLGINLLFDLVRRAAAVLNADYDAEIVEMHHRHKRDAPSGTALGLAEALAQGRGVNLKEVACYGREGVTGERPSGQIGIHGVRGGDVIGDHTVIFATDGERVELSHKASSREAFAKGALTAARWVQGRPPGLYTMRDVLGLK
jgi:4-hydroxy-tetrahydrodipicolinate reductase